MLQIVMNWEKRYPYQFDDGLFWYGQDFIDDFDQFVPGGQDDTETLLTEVASQVGASFDYNYHLHLITLEGLWLLRIQAEEILPATKAPQVPRCLGGKRASPLEDIPGIRDYEDCLMSLRNPKYPRHQEACELLGADFDPEAFDIDEVNRRLAMLETFRRQPESWRKKPSEALAVGRPPMGGRWLYGSRSRKS